jgi:sulfur relay (sulfurtransferase) DsrF/TusC family protein
MTDQVQAEVQAQPEIKLPLDLVNAALAALGECKAKDVFNIIQGIQNIALPQLPEELRNPPVEAAVVDATDAATVEAPAA